MLAFVILKISKRLVDKDETIISATYSKTLARRMFLTLS